MQSERFRPLVDAVGPFVSIHLDDSHDTADATAQLDARLRDIRKRLEDAAVGAGVIEAIDTAVRAKHPPVGRSGRAVVAAGEKIVLDQHLAVPPAVTTVRVSELPYILPVVEHGVLATTYLLVAVDHTGADIVVRDGTDRSETVAGGGHPVHKAHKADTAGYGGPQGRVDEAVRKNIREVADRVTRLFDEHGVDIVFLTGDARTELATALPDRVADKAVPVQGGGRAAGTDDAEVHTAMAEEFAKHRLAAVEDAAQRFNAGHGTGLAVQGLTEVIGALRDGAVDTLIIGDLGDRTVVADHDQLALIGPDTDTVSSLGGSPDRVLRADEALPLLAVATGAALVRTDERLAPTDGIGAVLRYPDMGQH